MRYCQSRDFGACSIGKTQRTDTGSGEYSDDVIRFNSFYVLTKFPHIQYNEWWCSARTNAGMTPPRRMARRLDPPHNATD